MLTVLTVGIGGLLGCDAFEDQPRNGLDKLPSRLCEGLVARDTVQSLLPPAEKAEASVDRDFPAPSEYGVGKVSRCQVSTVGTSLTGTSRVVDIDAWQWGIHAGRKSGYNTWNEEENGLYITTWADTAGVYFPCTPAELKPEDAKHRFALTVSIDLYGDHKPTGKELRRGMAKAALEIADRSRKEIGCREHTPLPAKLPTLISR